MIYATRLGINPARPSLVFSSFSNIILILSFRILQNVSPTVLNSVIPSAYATRQGGLVLRHGLESRIDCGIFSIEK